MSAVSLRRIFYKSNVVSIKEKKRSKTCHTFSSNRETIETCYLYKLKYSRDSTTKSATFGNRNLLAMLIAVRLN